MQITSIRLQNVRRFVDPVELNGIGPGLNVLSAPNEAGKSTFFDALHAVFFAGHRSWDKAVRALQPKAGGDPAVTVTFDADGAAWRLRKQWSSAAARKQAQLWCDGILVGQGEEAEDRLAGLIGAPADGGPAGLLWVNQGQVELDTGGDERKARLGIMESVAGEVEAMTGGQRMKAALAACEAFLGQHLTAKGRPKTGGGLAKATDEADRLATSRAVLEAEVTRLQEDLDRRRRVRGELAELQDDETVAAQACALTEAEARLKEARAHADKVELARRGVAELAARSEGLAGRVAGLGAALRERDDARVAEAEADTAAHDAIAAREVARTARDGAHVALTQAQTALEAAAAQTRKALQIEAAAGAQAQRDELGKRIETAERLRARQEAVQAEIARMPGEDALRAVEDAANTLHLAERARDAAAPAFVITYDAGAQGRVTRDGVAVPGDVAQPVPDGAELALDGIGWLRISPGETGSDDGVATAKQALIRALLGIEADTVDAARVLGQTRARALDDLRDIRAELGAQAPDGVAALRERLAALPAPVEPDLDLPSRDVAEATEADALAARAAAAEALAGAEAAMGVASDRAARAEAALEAAQARVANADAALGDEDDPQARLEMMQRDHAEQVADLEMARTTLTETQATAPDLEAAETAASRARSVVENARKQVAQLREDLAGLDARIAAMSGGAPEEQLALVTDQLAQAETRKEALAFEVAVNQRLHDALSQAMSAARDAYVEPVHRELLPLLRMLWPDADPVIDAETGMISAIRRRSVEEEFDILSGGTREQISLMVRLAFAHILAGRGTPAPVILDDAIVYTDDERIEHMFDALTRRARDVQIIAFSCRQRAFRELGGELLRITPAPEGGP